MEPIAIGIPDLPRLDGVLISHEHYDHCDLDAFAAYRDRAVPLFVAGTVVEAARKHGFTNVAALAPWQEAEVGGVTITAAPAKHGVYEVTFVLRAGSDRRCTSPETPCSSPNWPRSPSGWGTSPSPCCPPTACTSGRPTTCRS
ncbi:MBL fold metallo-hydrolase [Streptomyces sp. L7]